MMGISKSTLYNYLAESSTGSSVKRKSLPVEALLQLKRRLDTLPPRHEERRGQVEDMADLYGVSPATSIEHCGNCRSLRPLLVPIMADLARFPQAKWNNTVSSSLP